MRIGIDFDNTIACYDGVFHAAAVERHLIPPEIAADKTSVRNHLRSLGRDADFTELQGFVYGSRMNLVSLYPGVADTMTKLAAAKHTLFIVSHKTKAPIAGPAYDLHAAAREFLLTRRVVGDECGQIRAENIFFELTKEEKVVRISELRCDVFIDDLPEFLTLDGFPSGIRNILFDPDNQYPAGAWHGRSFERHRSWRAIADALLGG